MAMPFHCFLFCCCFSAEFSIHDCRNVRFFVCMCFGEEQNIIGHTTDASENNMV